MKSLKQRPDLPSRVRSLLEGLLERAANQFEHAISRTLDELEQELFKLAERSARSSAAVPISLRAFCCMSNPRSRISIPVPARRPKARAARYPEHRSS